MISTKKQAGISPLACFVCLFCLTAGTAIAEIWSGTLVDAGCYRSAKQNRNVYDLPSVRDVGMDIRSCAPKGKTHSFAIVQPDGEDVALDAAGNAQAAQLVRQRAGKTPLHVTVNGEMNKQTITASSVALAQ